MQRNIKAFISGCVVACVLTIAPFKSHAADSWVASDKLNHFAVSASMAKLSAYEYGAKTGILLAMVPGFLKELSDLGGSGTPSIRDMTANLVGSIVGAILPQQYMIAPIDHKGSLNGAMISYSVGF